MTELGTFLKDARKKKGYDLEDIHKITKIQKRYLEAIEAGNLDALPGHFYARAFVKSYAEAVDLDPETVLGHVKAELPIPPPQEHIAPLRRTRQHKAPIQAGRWLSRVLLYLFAVLILFVIYIAASKSYMSPDSEQNQTSPTAPLDQPQVEQGTGGTTNPEPSVDKQPDVTTPPPAVPTQPAEQKATLTFIAQENNTFRYELKGTKEINIQMTGNGNCWLRVLKGGQNGQKIDELTLTKGASKQWIITDSTEAWMRLGSAPDVQIKINDQPLDTSKMKRASQYISIVLKP